MTEENNKYGSAPLPDERFSSIAREFSRRAMLSEIEFEKMEKNSKRELRKYCDMPDDVSDEMLRKTLLEQYPNFLLVTGTETEKLYSTGYNDGYKVGFENALRMIEKDITLLKSNSNHFFNKGKDGD